MGFDDEDVLFIGDLPRRPRFTIRGLMIVVVVVAILVWAGREPGSQKFVVEHWLLILLELFPLYGLVWSIRRVYRVTPQRQTPSIVGLIVSLLAIPAALVLFMICTGPIFR